MSDKLKYEQDGHVVTLTLNMPETRNALTDQDLAAAIIAATWWIKTLIPTAWSTRSPTAPN